MLQFSFFYVFVGSTSGNYLFSQKERGIKPEEVIRDCKTQQSTEGLQQVQLLSPSVLVEIVGHAVCNVKENKVGGLRIITQPAQQMFLKPECLFMQFTSENDLQRLDISGITHKATSDSDILANYNLMISDVELKLDSHVCKDVLHGIVSLYINVCSFSFAKDIIQ